MTEVLIAIAVTLVTQLIAFSFWLGKLSQKVSGLCNDVPNIRREINELRSNDIGDLSQRVSYIEGELRQQSSDDDRSH